MIEKCLTTFPISNGMEPQLENKQNNNVTNQVNTTPTTSGAVSPDKPKEGKVVFHPEDKIVIRPLRTYADDVKNAIQDDNVSMVKIAMAEAKKQETEKAFEEELSPTSDKNKIIIGISLGVILLAVLGFVGVYYVAGNKQATVEVPQEHIQSIIPYDEDFVINLNTRERKKVLSGFESAESKTYDRNTSIVYLPIFIVDGTSTSVLNTSDFFNVLEARTPPALVRAFGDGFMLGFNRQSGKMSPFIILTSDSFNQLYAGMLEWEPAMADDLGDIFFSKEDLVDGPTSTSTEKNTQANIPKKENDLQTATNTSVTQSTSSQNIILKISTSSVASTTGSSSISVLAPKDNNVRYIIANSLKFKDEVLNNKDLRVLRTLSGKTLMYYTFINDKIVLIAKDFNTLDEVVKRLATSQFKQ